VSVHFIIISIIIISYYSNFVNAGVNYLFKLIQCRIITFQLFYQLILRNVRDNSSILYIVTNIDKLKNYSVGKFNNTIVKIIIDNCYNYSLQ
jgi:hypothetical protein